MMDSIILLHIIDHPEIAPKLKSIVWTFLLLENWFITKVGVSPDPIMFLSQWANFWTDSPIVPTDVIYLKDKECCELAEKPMFADPQRDDSCGDSKIYNFCSCQHLDCLYGTCKNQEPLHLFQLLLQPCEFNTVAKIWVSCLQTISFCLIHLIQI